LTIFITSPVAPFSSGSVAGTQSSNQNFTVPSGAVELISIRGHATCEAPSVAEGLLIKFSLSGQDFRNTPYDFFSELGGSKLGVVGGCGYNVEPRFWRANLPVKAGSTIAVNSTSIDSVAGGTEALIDCLWSDQPTGLRPVQRLASTGTASSTSTGSSICLWSDQPTGLRPVQRLASTGTASSTSTGSSITLSGGLRVVDMAYAYLPGGVVVVDEETTSRLTLNSGGFAGQQTISMGNVTHAIEQTSGQIKANLMRCNLDIPIRDDPAIVTSSVNVSSSSTNDDSYLYALGFEIKNNI